MATLRLDQHILGDRVPFVDVAAEALEAERRNALVSTASTFDMGPVDAASCEELE